MATSNRAGRNLVSSPSPAFAFCLAFALSLTAPSPARGEKHEPPDKIFLKNGDRVSGKVVELGDEELVVETPFSGKLRIKREWVIRVEPPLPARITLKTGETVEGKVEAITKEALTLSVDRERREVRNPEVWGLDIPGREKPPWRGSVAGGLSLNTGNAETFGYNLRGELLRETLRTELRFKGHHVFERANGDIRTNRSDGEGRWAHFWTPQWFYFVRERVETDRIADVDLRSDSHLGVGRRLLDRKAARLEFELGPGYEFSRFEAGDREETPTARLGSLLRLGFPRDITVEFEGEAIQGLKDSDSLTLRGEGKLSVPLRDGLHFLLTLQDRYDNTPAPGRERNDLSLFSNLEFRF